MSQTFQNISKKLVNDSIKHGINAFQSFDWPDELEEDQYWFSPDALSVSGTHMIDSLSKQQLIALSKWECINSFSLNTLGECELIENITRVLKQLDIGEAREYLFHFINEENQHMWYFQKFCNQYAGKVYPSIAMPIEKATLRLELDQFLVFARIVLFEEIGHYFNIINSKDERVHPFVREINQAHYNDEARHITFGRRVLRELAQSALTSDEDVAVVEDELTKTLMINYTALYNPSMYRDAALQAPMEIRTSLIDHPDRQSLYKNVILKTLNKHCKK